MGNLYFIRTFEVNTYRNGQLILSYSSQNVDPNSETANRIKFECSPFAGIGEPSYLHVSIYNPSAQDVNNILLNDIIEVKVGYLQRGTGTIFYGQVMSFWGYDLVEGSDFNYVYNIYSLAYFGGDQNNLSPQLSPIALDLSKNALGAPPTIGTQAAYIANQYGYKPNPNNILASYANTPAKNIIVVGNNMDDILNDFFKKTGAAIVLDNRDRSYGLIPAQPTSSNYAELIAGKEILATLDNNNGLIGYPSYDVMTGFINFTALVDTTVDFYSVIQVDTSNSVLVSVDKTLNQDLIVDLRNYKTYVVFDIRYNGDTRENNWYQVITAFGQF